MSREPCCAYVQTSVGHARPCLKSGSYRIDGRLYCFHHHPPVSSAYVPVTAPEPIPTRPRTRIPETVAAFETAVEIWNRHTDGAMLHRDEGWEMFSCNGRLEIQRDDEACVFEYDEGAYNHVMTEALHGSPLHVLAIYLHGHELGKEVYLPQPIRSCLASMPPKPVRRRPKREEREDPRAAQQRVIVLGGAK